MKWILVLVLTTVGAFATPASATLDMNFIKEKLKSYVIEAQNCAKQMSEIGFYFDEIRTEIDLTPKIELYFRDGGGAARATVPSTINGSCQSMAKMLLTTRDIHYGGYRLKGVKVTLPSPKVELIHVVAP